MDLWERLKSLREMGIKHPKSIIVGLDDLNPEKAFEVVDELKDLVWGFKVSDDLFDCYEHPFTLIDKIHRKGSRVFADVMLYGMPSRVAKRVASYTAAEFISISAVGGMQMMQAAVEAKISITRAAKIALSFILTSLDETEIHHIFGGPSEVKFVEFVRDALIAGIDTVYCSGEDAETLNRYKEFNGIERIVAGVRPGGLPVKDDDQKRTMSAKEAKEKGADLLVISRPILQNPPYLEAVRKILEEINE